MQATLSGAEWHANQWKKTCKSAACKSVTRPVRQRSQEVQGVQWAWTCLSPLFVWLKGLCLCHRTKFFNSSCLSSSPPLWRCDCEGPQWTLFTLQISNTKSQCVLRTAYPSHDAAVSTIYFVGSLWALLMQDSSTGLSHPIDRIYTDVRVVRVQEWALSCGQRVAMQSTRCIWL